MLRDRMNKRPDRRRERTQRQLMDALLVLVLERNYGDIRIEDICNRADLGRATFYLHYTSKDDLLSAALIRILNDDHTASLHQLGSVDRSLGLARAVFAHVKAYRDLYRSLQRSVEAAIIDRRISAFLEQITRAELDKLFTLYGIAVSDKHLRFITVYLASALHGMMIWTASLEDDLDVDLLAAQYHTFTHAGFTAFLAAFAIPG